MSLYALREDFPLSLSSWIRACGPELLFKSILDAAAIMGVHRPPDFDITNRVSTEKYPVVRPVNRYALYVIRSRVVITDLRNRADEIAP